MDINIGDMRTTSLGAGDVTLEGTIPAVAAEATDQGITFRAVTAGEDGNGITIKFEAGTDNSTSVAVSGTTITVTLGVTGDENPTISATTADVVNAINTSNEAKVLVVASGGDTSTTAGETTEPIALSGGADETLITVTLDTISHLKVDDAEIDSITENTLDDLSNEGVLTQDGANKAIANVNNAIEQVSAERSKLSPVFVT
jgi:flagellin-like hook-associated protein FlgL